ncbi:MAG: hypothetical protein HYV63_03605 [Candidatus Schekmanbacteria bacterium]|nr:hypothetical protein [Candidatus Schekmanbacteria bacterium]
MGRKDIQTRNTYYILARTVTVYQLAQVPRVLGIDETLEGGDVLPGFACLVDEIFG